jgi:hypothetical protein
MKKTLSVLLFLGMLPISQTQGFAQAPDPTVLCTPPQPPAGVLVYEISVANRSTQGKRRYGVEDQVQINVVDKNPFFFTHTVRVDEKVIPEPALATFFKLFDTSPTAALLATVNAPKTTAPPPAPSPNPAVRGVPDPCQTAFQDIESLRTQYASLKTSAERVTNLFADLKKKADPETQLDERMTCKTLVAAAGGIVQSIRSAFTGSLGQDLNSFKTALKAFKTDLARHKETSEELAIRLTRARCTDDFVVTAVKDYRAMKESVDPDNGNGLQKVANDFDAAAQKAQDTATQMANLLADSHNFYETHSTGGFTEAHDVTVTVERKNKKTGLDVPEFLKTEIHFGGRPRFALAAGAAFGQVGQTTYKVSQGLTPDTENPGQNKVIQVVGVDERSSGRAVPLVMLHARISEQNGWIPPIHGSFGFAGNTANNGLNLEYLVGLSASFAEERFFFTLGGYNGRTQKLQKDFSVGQELPTGITEVPVTRGRSWGLGFALTVRFNQ